MPLAASVSRKEILGQSATKAGLDLARLHMCRAPLVSLVIFR